MNLYPQVLALFISLFGCGDDMSQVAYYVPATQRCIHEPRMPEAPREAQTTPLKPPAPKSAKPAVVAKVDINTATSEELQKLPGIGPAMAGRILAYRAERPFRRPREIKRIRGIGPATYAKLRPLIRVSRAGEDAQKVTP